MTNKFRMTLAAMGLVLLGAGMMAKPAQATTAWVCGKIIKCSGPNGCFVNSAQNGVVNECACSVACPQ